MLAQQPGWPPHPPQPPAGITLALPLPPPQVSAPGTGAPAPFEAAEAQRTPEQAEADLARRDLQAQLDRQNAEIARLQAELTARKVGVRALGLWVVDG